MTNNEIINVLANSKELKNYAFKLCNGRDIHNDLFQEFLIKIFNLDNDYLQNKINNIQLISFCKVVLKNINLDRIRANNNIKSKNVLVEKVNDFESDYILNTLVAEQQNENELYKKTLDFINSDKIKQHEALLLIDSVFLTHEQLAKKTNVNQRAIYYELKKIKTKIKENVKY